MPTPNSKEADYRLKLDELRSSGERVSEEPPSRREGEK